MQGKLLQQLELIHNMFKQGEIEGVSGKGGQVPFENLGDHIVGIKQNFGTLLNYCNIW